MLRIHLVHIADFLILTGGATLEDIDWETGLL